MHSMFFIHYIFGHFQEYINIMSPIYHKTAIKQSTSKWVPVKVYHIYGMTHNEGYLIVQSLIIHTVVVTCGIFH